MRQTGITVMCPAHLIRTFGRKLNISESVYGTSLAFLQLYIKGNLRACVWKDNDPFPAHSRRGVPMVSVSISPSLSESDNIPASPRPSGRENRREHSSALTGVTFLPDGTLFTCFPTRS